MEYFLKHKFDVLEKFKEYVNFVENKFQRHVKTLRIDNGKEYCHIIIICNKQMHGYLRAKRISLETIIPYTPEKNG